MTTRQLPTPSPELKAARDAIRATLTNRELNTNTIQDAFYRFNEYPSARTLQNIQANVDAYRKDEADYEAMRLNWVHQARA